MMGGGLTVRSEPKLVNFVHAQFAASLDTGEIVDPEGKPGAYNGGDLPFH